MSAEDKILIKNLVTRGIIGVNDWERENPQRIVINLVIYADTQQAGESDDLDQTVNYRTVAKRVLRHAETAARLTVEALAEDIAKLVLKEPNAQRVVVRVEKPQAVRFSESVGVEIERSKD